MSTDTKGLFEVTDTSQAMEDIRICAVRTMPDPLCAVGERFGDCWLPKRWEYDDRGNLLGPGGFSIRGKLGIVEVYHLLPYSLFVRQDEGGRLVLAAFRFIGRLIGSPEVVLIHELLPWEGSTLDAVTRSIEEQIGPPATSWKKLSTCELFEPRCWMRIQTEEEPGELKTMPPPGS